MYNTTQKIKFYYKTVLECTKYIIILIIMVRSQIVIKYSKHVMIFPCNDGHKGTYLNGPNSY